jgi:predicted DCC family thiol-disulfide oxidoreductase YuxK
MIIYSPILIFDGNCNLCNGLVKFIIKQDNRGRILCVYLQSETGKSLIANFSIDPSDIDSAIFISSEGLFLKSSAILHLFKELGGVWKLLYGFIIFPLFIRDSLYNLVARNRYKMFGRQVSCVYPVIPVSNDN